MSFELLFTPRFQRVERRFLARHLELLGAYRKTLRLLEVDPFHPSLRLHARQGRLAGLHSASINMSYRITLKLWIQDGRIVPIDVGDHDDVY